MSIVAKVGNIEVLDAGDAIEITELYDDGSGSETIIVGYKQLIDLANALLRARAEQTKRASDNDPSVGDGP